MPRTIEFRVEVVIERDGDGYHAYCPALKGLHMGGDTEEEALANARDAVIAYLESLIEDGEPIPVGVVKGENEPVAKGQAVHTAEVEVACA